MAENQTTGAAQTHGEVTPETEQSGTAEEQARNAENLQRLNMEWKGKAERLNEVERENAELKAREAERERMEQSPAATNAPSNDYWGELEKHAADGNAFAKAQLATRDGMLAMSALAEIDDRSERLEVQKRLEARGFRGDVRSVHNEVQLEKARDREKKKDEELAAERAKVAAYEAREKSGIMNAPRTGIPHDGGPPQTKPEMTLAEINQAVERARENGGEGAAMAIQRKVRLGQIKTI